MDIRLSSPLVEFVVDVRLTRRGSMWVAAAEGTGRRMTGLGRTAHEALAASISFLGRNTASALLADPGLMAPSAQML